MTTYVAFGIVVDDIVYADGRTVRGVLGGGGPQAAFGMRLWSDSVGLVANVGNDLPESAWEWMEQSGIDRRGVRKTDLPTPRAWQRLDAEGRRRQEWQVPGPVIGGQLARSWGRLPEEYRSAKGFHYGIHPDDPDLSLAEELRRRGVLVSLEPFREANQPLDRPQLEAILSAAQIFSPNLGEARSMLGPGEPLELARRLVELGAEVAALRLGSAGSLVVDKTSGDAVLVPVAPVNFVDPIGAGNAYCGGFLVGWHETRDPARAGAYGAVAASFLGEQTGVPVCTEPVRREAQRRLDVLLPSITRM